MPKTSGRSGARGLVGAARSSIAAGAHGSSSARRTYRTGSSHAGMGIFGRNESDLESGTVGGVRAASESDDDGSPRLSGAFADDSDDSPSADTAHEATYRRAPNRNRHGMSNAVTTKTDGLCMPAPTTNILRRKTIDSGQIMLAAPSLALLFRQHLHADAAKPS